MRLKKIIQKFSRYQLSNQGLGLIEVLVVMAMMIVVVLATYSMFNSLRKQQSKQKLVATFLQLKGQFHNILATEIAWRNTVNDTANSELSCVRSGTNCATYYALSYATSLPRLNLRNGGPNGGLNFYRSRGTPMSLGFNEDGQACSTFTSAAAGNDACPIGYIVNWRAVNATDINPQVVVVAKMVYNPTATHPLRNFFNAGPNSTTINRYDIEVTRNASTIAKGFTVRILGPPASGPGALCTLGGFGACNISGGWTSFGNGAAQPFGTGVFIEASDPYDLIEIVGSEIRVRNPSTLKCQITTYAVGVDTVRLRLQRTNGASPGTVAAVSSFASNTATTYTTIQLNANNVQITENNTHFEIQQQCGVAPPVALGVDSSGCALGYKTNLADADSTRLMMSCSVLD